MKPLLFFASLFTFGHAIAFAQPTDPPKFDPSFSEKAARLQIVSAALNSIDEFGDDLEIVDSQKIKAKEIIRTYFISTRSIVANFANAQAESNNGKNVDMAKEKETYEAAMSKLVEKATVDIERVFLPHQLERILQLSKQVEASARFKTKGMFLVEHLLDEIDSLPENEKQQLVKRIREIKKDYDNRVANLNSEFESKLDDVIPEEIRKEIEKKYGKILIGR